MNIKKIGNEFETKFATELKNKGFWCHIFEYNNNGQPCDIVALKDNEGTLIDVKHCEANRFPFSDIRPNQITCFEYAKSCGNEKCYFAIWFERKQGWYLLSLEQLKTALHYGMKSVSWEELQEWK